MLLQVTMKILPVGDVVALSRHSYSPNYLVKWVDVPEEHLNGLASNRGGNKLRVQHTLLAQHPNAEKELRHPLSRLMHLGGRFGTMRRAKVLFVFLDRRVPIDLPP